MMSDWKNPQRNEDRSIREFNSVQNSAFLTLPCATMRPATDNARVGVGSEQLECDVSCADVDFGWTIFLETIEICKSSLL